MTKRPHLKHLPITKQELVDKLFAVQGYYMQKKKRRVSMEDAVGLALDDLNEYIKLEESL